MNKRRLYTAFFAAISAACVFMRASGATALNDIPGTAEVYTAAETDSAIATAVGAIPEPDFTSSNTQLVATIKAKSPAPGNYFAVSNAAMSASANATNYADYALGRFAETGAVSRITDGTNTIDVAGNVYSVGYTNTVWIWRGDTDYGQPIWKNADEFDSYFWWLESVSLEPTSEFPYGQNATNLVFEIYDGVFASCYRNTFTVTNYVGKLALTNDIDYTINNTQLVDTIEATAPAPGNYSAVSNAAMNARSVMEMGVRGTPQGEGSWFLVNGKKFIYNNEYWMNGLDSISLTLNPGAYDYIDEYGVEFEFILGNDFVSFMTHGTNTYIIVGYTNALAQVSQIPTIPQGLVTTNSSGTIGANLAVKGTLYVSIDDSPDFGVATNTGVRITNQGTIAITDGGLERGLSILADGMFMVDMSRNEIYDYFFPTESGTFALVSQIPDVPLASDGLPHMDGPASAGTTNEWSRVDHVHPSDTSKMNGAAAYPAWEEREYDSGSIVSYNGRLWRADEDTLGNRVPGDSPEWSRVTIGVLKQDALPYPTNAIPYAAISGTPSLAGQTFDFSRNYDIIRATAAIAEALGATITNNPTAQGGN